MVGAVAYDQKVIPIWEGIKGYFRGAPVEMDVVWFSNYDAQVDALLAGWIDIAWNTNLAYVRTHHETAGACRALAMRDTDVGFRTLLVGRAGELGNVRDLKGRALALGSADSAQAAIMPVFYLAREGLTEGEDLRLVRFDSDVGKHGDTGTSERDAVKAVLDGTADAAAVGAASWDVFVRSGEVPPGRLEPFWTSPPYNHCNFTALPSFDTDRATAWTAPPHGDGMGEPGTPADPRARGAPRVDRAGAGGLPRRVRRRRRAEDRRAVVTGEPAATFDGEDLDLASGLVFALDVCLSDIEVGEVLALTSRSPGLAHELPAWCRGTGHELVGVEPDGDRTLYLIRRGAAGSLMFKDRPDWGITPAFRHDGFDTRDWLIGKAGEIPERADPTTGFSPRGAVVEDGAPAFPYTETERDRVWANNVANLYEQATAAQWDASTDIRWHDLRPLPMHVERAVCQIMTHLAENEYAALYVPARFIPRVHPHFTEVALFLASQVNDEARHIEAFTKRALANGGGLQYSTAQTQSSLRSLLEQEDFSQASFLLSVLGEGTFLEYLAFVERFAPEPVTADIVRRARIDEARHVAFGVEHARHYLAADPDRAGVLYDSVRRRAEYLADASGASPHVEEALVVLAAGGVRPTQLREGVAAVRALHETMHRRRVVRLTQLGFPASTAEEISELHTSNFM